MCTNKYPTGKLVMVAAAHKASPAGFSKGFSNPRTHGLLESMDKLGIIPVYFRKSLPTCYGTADQGMLSTFFVKMSENK